ncbi:hypothetical protein IFM89_028727 [Coptis chinensis]|uniref:Uncharacterized protein n=1 Tax=Coptis chinensis TaxID=261450 RepID=A0A835LET3_9MAGN|nr:hypothetical protein IFM89_028727 [Coptis chinensis]
MARVFYVSKIPTRTPNSTKIIPFYTSFIFSMFADSVEHSDDVKMDKFGVNYQVWIDYQDSLLNVTKAVADNHFTNPRIFHGGTIEISMVAQNSIVPLDANIHQSLAFPDRASTTMSSVYNQQYKGKRTMQSLGSYMAVFDICLKYVLDPLQ